ncbi:MAG: SRPBCC domain-containing protein [Bacteriovoracia bacterium]
MQVSQEKNGRPENHKNSTPAAPLLELEREFSVPVSRLFAAFKTPKEIKAWWWPNGLRTDLAELDFREGGRYFINMKGKVNGTDGGGGMTGEFKEIIEDELIVMSDQFADENGRAISPQEAKMPGIWPEFVYITFDFTSLDENRSRVKLSQEGIPSELQKDCRQGWSEMFNKLENHLGAHKH